MRHNKEKSKTRRYYRVKRLFLLMADQLFILYHNIFNYSTVFPTLYGYIMPIKSIESRFICPLQKISLQGFGITYLK